MQNIDLSHLVTVKFDMSIIQDTLSLTIKDIYTKLSKLQSQQSNLNQSSQNLDKQTHKIYQLIQKSNQHNSQLYKQLDDKINQFHKLHNINGTSDIIQKTPKQVLDHIQNRLKINLNNQGNKNLDINCNPPNTDRIIQTIRVKQSPRSITGADQKQLLDQKVYEFYQKTVQKIQAQLTQLRRQFRMQINQITTKSTKIIDQSIITKNSTNDKNIDKSKSKKIKNNSNFNTKKHNQNNNQIPQFDSLFDNQSKSQKNVTISKKVIQITPTQQQQQTKQQQIQPQQPRNNQKTTNNNNNLLRQQFQQLIQQLKNQMKFRIQQVIINNQQKIQQITRTNSILADHLVQTKKSIQDIIHDKDTLKIQVLSIRQKNLTSQKQLNLLIDTVNQNKNKFKIVDNNINKINQQIKQLKLNYQIIKQQQHQQQNINNNKKDAFRDSHSSFRSSLVGNLNPIRNNSILKVSNGRIDILEQNVKNTSNKLASLLQRFNRMQDQKKRLELSQFSSSLPKIDKQNKSNINPIQIIKKQLKKLNEDLTKTNQKLTTTKDRLNNLYQTHAQVPNKIQDIYNKLRQYNQLQQDRLIQLIKQLINRILSDPFDNNFTNRLKRQINVKFLQIKYQYNSILKQIQNKVQNRAEINQLQKINNKFQQSILQVKSIANKKCDIQDFKKGIKYIENKIKQVFQFAKNQTVALANQQKQYIGAKKQSLH